MMTADENPGGGTPGFSIPNFGNGKAETHRLVH